MENTEHHANVAAILARLGVSFEIVRAPRDGKDITTRDNNWKCYAWRVRFQRARVSEEFDYFTGTGRVTDNSKRFRKDSAFYVVRPTIPTSADLLYSLLRDGEALDQSFQNWCDEFDGDSDSLKSLDTYRACCKIGQQLRKLFSHAEREELGKALEDF